MNKSGVFKVANDTVGYNRRIQVTLCCSTCYNVDHTGVSLEGFSSQFHTFTSWLVLRESESPRKTFMQCL
jgi:hypothetical protein